MTHRSMSERSTSELCPLPKTDQRQTSATGIHFPEFVELVLGYCDDVAPVVGVLALLQLEVDLDVLQQVLDVDDRQALRDNKTIVVTTNTGVHFRH